MQFKCDDGKFCSGKKIRNCQCGCQGGMPPNCSDCVSCTDDSCDEENNKCINTLNNGKCTNFLFCDGEEMCLPGTAPNCNDGIKCTMDLCNEQNDACMNEPDNAFCDNGEFFNGTKKCDAVDDCQDGMPPNCNDSDDCTVDVCNEENDKCIDTRKQIHHLKHGAGSFLCGVKKEDVSKQGNGCDTFGCNTGVVAAVEALQDSGTDDCKEKDIVSDWKTCPNNEALSNCGVIECGSNKCMKFDV